jgi:hypothetical protein
LSHQDPYAYLPDDLKQKLTASRGRLVQAYDTADDALRRYTDSGFDQTHLRYAAEILCRGMAELRYPKHSLWFALREYPQVLNPRANFVSEMVAERKKFFDAETKILQAVGMSQTTAAELARTVSDAFESLDWERHATTTERSTQIDALIAVSAILSRDVCQAATRLPLEAGGQAPERPHGVRAFVSKVAKSKIFVGSAAAALADLTTGGSIPVVGWFAAAATSPLAAFLQLRSQ